MQSARKVSLISLSSISESIHKEKCKTKFGRPFLLSRYSFVYDSIGKPFAAKRLVFELMDEI